MINKNSVDGLMDEPLRDDEKNAMFETKAIVYHLNTQNSKEESKDALRDKINVGTVKLNIHSTDFIPPNNKGSGAL